ncbi:L-histidine N(alpha)-methyltransferase [Aureibacter tunicatorum]|uniref:Dimethylhistidine N-methyltransferase n=1 Tax=Aureibacter tunicatorum TaxID=866807 RepID=A0AAE3XI68_9BACT|nr:L-histidine N(alpha)-methyltransferase [Aureibacter tunicatorum]MDR6237257.1 dimethylhistidine N-methyltransferase [Aureibacter tunicatorum]BDD06249.1 dimethylhistidine N-methyltransferase [Aureibacter tunicatorum]
MNQLNESLVETQIDLQNAQEIKNGLSEIPKHISSKFFYDEVGDEIFKEIMRCEHYYPTKAEEEILILYSQQLAKQIDKTKKLQIIELGAGDGSKIIHLLKAFKEANIDFIYQPIDISQNILDELEKNVSSEIKDIEIKAICSDYFDYLAQEQGSDEQKLLLFLGGNIGNMFPIEAAEFLEKINSLLSPKDLFLVGLDLKKNPRIIQNAYNDPDGITKRFNLNLLERMNREFGADFNIQSFSHYPFYDPISGSMKSYLISEEKQIVTFKHLNWQFALEKDECIFTEVSQKYSFDDIEELASKSGFKIINNFIDSEGYFTDSLWQKNSSKQ